MKAAFARWVLVIAATAAGAAELPRYCERLDLTYYLTARGERQPIRKARDWEVRRGQALAGLRAVMGPLPGKERRVPLEVEVLAEERVGTVRRQKIRYRTEPGDRVQAYLFLPETKGRKVPAVLCLQQTTQLGKAEAAGLGGDPNLHYALHLAQRGYVTLAPDYPGFGESRWDFDAAGKAPFHYQSGTAKAVWDNLRSVDLLETLPEVDRSRIGCLGHSLGGHMTIFTAVFDPRLKVLVSSCGFSHFRKDDVPSWTGPRYMPRIASEFGNDPARVPFDFPELIAALAPRPFLACAAKKDDDFDYTGVEEVIRAARPVYRLYGSEGKVEAFYPEGGHGFPPEARERAYAFLDRFLKPHRQ